MLHEVRSLAQAFSFSKTSYKFTNPQHGNRLSWKHCPTVFHRRTYIVTPQNWPSKRTPFQGTKCELAINMLLVHEVRWSFKITWNYMKSLKLQNHAPYSQLGPPVLSYTAGFREKRTSAKCSDPVSWFCFLPVRGSLATLPIGHLRLYPLKTRNTVTCDPTSFYCAHHTKLHLVTCDPTHHYKGKHYPVTCDPTYTNRSGHKRPLTT